MNLKTKLNRLRVTLVFTSIAIVLGALYFGAAFLTGMTALDYALSIGLALIAALLLGTTFEWLTHRYIMHRPHRFRLLDMIYRLHHVGHHHIHWTPDKYSYAGRLNISRSHLLIYRSSIRAGVGVFLAL